MVSPLADPAQSPAVSAPMRARAAWRALAPWVPAALLLAAGLIVVTAMHRSLRAWNDFAGYIDAGRSLSHGVYSLTDSNTWPPFFSLVAVPISWLDLIPAAVARLFWAVLTAGVFSWSAWAWWREAKPEGTPAWVAPAAAFLIAPFGLHHIVYHQVYAFIFACAALGFRDAQKGRDLRAGMWLGLGAAAKVTPGLTLLYFAFARRWRVVLAGAATLVLCSLALVPFLGAAGVVHAYQRWLLVIGNLGGPHGVLNQGLPAEIDRLFTTRPQLEGVGAAPLIALPPDVVARAGRLVSLCAFAYLAALLANRRVKPLEAFAPLVAASVYVAPYCWRSQLIAFLPLLLLTLSHAASERDPWGLVLLAPFVLLMPEREPSLIGWKAYTVTEGVGFTSLAVLLLLVNGARWVGRGATRPGWTGQMPAPPPP